MQICKKCNQIEDSGTHKYQCLGLPLPKRDNSPIVKFLSGLNKVMVNGDSLEWEGCLIMKSNNALQFEALSIEGE